MLLNVYLHRLHVKLYQTPFWPVSEEREGSCLVCLCWGLQEGSERLLRGCFLCFLVQQEDRTPVHPVAPVWEQEEHPPANDMRLHSQSILQTVFNIQWQKPFLTYSWKIAAETVEILKLCQRRETAKVLQDEVHTVIKWQCAADTWIKIMKYFLYYWSSVEVI